MYRVIANVIFNTLVQKKNMIQHNTCSSLKPNNKVKPKLKTVKVHWFQLRCVSIIIIM